MSRPRRDTPAAPASQRRMPNGWCGELPNRDGHYRAAAARVRHHHHHGHPRRAPDRSPLPAGAGSPRGLPTTRLPATSRTAAVCGYRPQNHTPACSAPISGAPAAGPSAWSRRLRDRPCHGSSRHRVTRRPAPRRPFISSHLGSCRCRRAGSPIASPRSPRQRGRVVIRRLPRSRERRSTARSRRRPRSRARRRPSLPRSHAADHAAALAGPPRCERPRAAGPRRGGRVRDAPLDSRGFHADGLPARLLVSPRQATGITETAVVSYSIGPRTVAEVARSAATFSP